MVDDRAEHRRAFEYSEPAADWRPSFLERLAGWFAPSPAPDAGDAREGWLHANRLPLAVSAIWFGALGLYAVGYVGRLGAADGARPALELLFFVFAAVGPVAMLWMVWRLQARAAGLSDALAAQSESALAVAATLANLHDAVESLADNTTERLTDASARVERRSDAALARVDNATTELAGRIEEALRDTLRLLDEGLRERTARFEAALDAQREALAKRLGEDADRLARTVEHETQNLASVQETLADRIAGGFAENGARFDRAAGELLGSLQSRLEGVGQRAEQALSKVAAELSAAQAERQRDLDGELRQREERLSAALDAAARTVEGEIRPLVSGLRDALADTRESVAAHPPASAAELAGLLGEAAEQRIRPEREAFEQLLVRIAALEEQACGLLDQIDRTSRLNPLMEVPEAQPSVGGDRDAVELPFAALPRASGVQPLDWTAVVRALSGEAPKEGRRHAIEQACADRDVGSLIALTRDAAEALAEDGLYLSDLAPVHGPAELWARFGAGERGGEITELAGIDDEVAIAIARARLRDDPAFRRLGMRLIAAYTRLIERAAAEMGPDPRLVELAETRPGRAFQLLAEPLRALRPIPSAGES